jgi:uncharacterized protein (TIGR03067 family)
VKLPWLIVSACGLLLASCEGKGTTAMSDWESIQGTWQLVSGERNGASISEGVAAQVQLVFEDNRLLTRNRDRVTEAKFLLGPGAKPAAIDLEMDGQIGQGIYSLSGDTLRIVHGEAGDPRPAELSPERSSGLTILVLKRANS